jgi:hypothetical protein
LLMRNQGNIEFETLENQCWSYLRNIQTAINYFYKHFAHNLPYTHISHMKNLSKHLDLPNTGIFYSKDVASGSETWIFFVFGSPILLREEKFGSSQIRFHIITLVN